MNRKIIFLVIAVGLVGIGIYNFQGTIKNSEGYIEKIEAERLEKNELFKNSEESPLTKEQKERFSSLIYFPIAEKYKVQTEFHKNSSEQTIKIAISDGSQREFIVFGNVHLHLEGKELDLTVYKSMESETEYLFIPFYDLSSADLTYGGGRYVEPVLLGTGQIEIDFNLAYNPYCAYNHTYRCPIPPQENNLQVSILAGEKNPDFMK